MEAMGLAPGIHVWHRCHGCGAEPIAGLRYDCKSCPAGPDNHLCAACYEAYTHGRVTHPAPDSLASFGPNIAHRFEAARGVPRETFDTWTNLSVPAASPPTIADRCIVRPEFRRGRMSYFGSYAFVAERAPGSRVVMTALHVMDELIKASGVDCSPEAAAYTGEELPAMIDDVQLYDVFAPKWMLARVGAARAMVVLPHARTGEDEPYCQSDLAAFAVDESSSTLNAMRLARAPAERGEPVWLAVNGDPRRSSRTTAAVVVERTTRTMVFRFAGDGALPRHSSGAPVLNARGEVVGINVGRGALDGHRFGHAIHVESIHRLLDAAPTRDQ